MIDIVFVCTGNTCRSAMAEAILNDTIIKENLGDKIRVSSAGIGAFPGDMATDEAITVMRDDYQIDLTAHSAKNISDINLNNMDLILTMTDKHKRILLNKYPNLNGKIYTLREYAYQNTEILDINDPYGYGESTYRQCADEISECIIRLINKFKETKKI